MQSASHIKIKVCGMRDHGNIREIAQLRPDYMGFIFYPGSKRVVNAEFELPHDFPESIKRVGVFVNEETAQIMKLSKLHRLDLVQLHGEESVDRCSTIRDGGIKVIKTFSIGADFSFDNLLPYRNSVDYFLFDTKGLERGGTGVSFDWKILERYDQQVPFFLSGGLSTNNIRNVGRLRGMNIHAIDLNSGIEIAPGLKDVGLVREIQSTMMNSHWLQY